MFWYHWIRLIETNRMVPKLSKLDHWVIIYSSFCKIIYINIQIFKIFYIVEGGIKSYYVGVHNVIYGCPQSGICDLAILYSKSYRYAYCNLLCIAYLFKNELSILILKHPF